MKKITIYIFALLIGMPVMAQTNFSGSYGYSFKAQEGAPKDKEDEGPSGRLVLLKMDDNKYRFWMDVNRGFPSYNMGESDGTLTFKNDTASFDNTYEGAADSCILKFKVDGNKIIIKSSAYGADCGFGNGVMADGEYMRAKTQPVLDYEWLKKQYTQSPHITIASKKAEVFQDENCLRPFPKSPYFIKGDKLLSIAETEKTVYTEFITSSGKFIYGWIKKTDITMEDTD